MTVSTSGYGNVFGVWPSAQAPTSYAEALECRDAEFSRALHLALRELGVLVMPSPYGRFYLSCAHDDGVVEEMKNAFAVAASKLAGRFG